MTRKEAVRLASRAFALYLIVWGLTDVTYLPQVFFAFHHYSDSVFVPHGYSWTYYRIDATFYIVRIVGLFAIAAWLLRSGDGVENFFFPADKLHPPEATMEDLPHHNAD